MKASTRVVGDTVVTGLIFVGITFLAVAPRPILLAVPMPGYGLPVCQTEDATPPGGCVWPASGATWINYPGRP